VSPTPFLRGLLILFLWLPQLVLAGTGSGFVLCLAPGDHLQVELAGGACCSAEPGTNRLDRDAALESGPAGPSRECPACEDVEVLGDPIHPSRQTAEAPPPAPCPAAPPFEVEPPSRAGLRGPGTPHRPGAHLALLRTIVLRC
jgi:hypothetical protein